MTIYVVVPALLILALLQATIVPHLAIWGVFPDLPVLIVASWGLLRGKAEGSVWGFIAGVAVDLFSGAPFGAATLSLMAVGFVSGLGKTSALRTHVGLPVLIVFLTTILYSTAFLSILLISGQSVLWLNSLWRIVLPSAALNALLTPVFFGGMRWLNTRLGQAEMEW